MPEIKQSLCHNVFVSPITYNQFNVTSLLFSRLQHILSNPTFLIKKPYKKITNLTFVGTFLEHFLKNLEKSSIVVNSKRTRRPERKNALAMAETIGDASYLDSGIFRLPSSSTAVFELFKNFTLNYHNHGLRHLLFSEIQFPLTALLIILIIIFTSKLI